LFTAHQSLFRRAAGLVSAQKLAQVREAVIALIATGQPREQAK